MGVSEYFSLILGCAFANFSFIYEKFKNYLLKFYKKADPPKPIIS